MYYAKELDRISALIEEDIDNQLKKEMSQGKIYHPFAGNLYELLQEYVLRRGKRLASTATVIVYEGYKGKIDEEIVKAATSIELYRHSILNHDDIVDAEEMRRGGRTVHRMFEENYDERFGIGTAIFAGNILFSLSLGVLLKSGFDCSSLKQVVDLYSSGFRDVNESQILDLLFEYTKPTVDDWNKMAGKRAASLFQTAILTGAILGEAPGEDIPKLQHAAKHLGYAFDIQDDIIDTFASKEQYGREPGGDLLKSKKPLHVILAMEKDQKIAKLMEQQSRIQNVEIPVIIELIRACGALEEAKSISREHGIKGKKLISMTGMNEKAKDFFFSLTDYVVESLEWYK